MSKFYEGILIRKHVVKDADSKAAAANSLYGWESAQLTGNDWVDALTKGHTIQPGCFVTSEDGIYTHNKENWRYTHFVCADADNIKGVEFNDDGSDKNPNGVEAWTEDKQLSKIYPDLKSEVYAVLQSVSSMTNEKGEPHRRYRLIFVFDEPIQSEAHYHHVLKTLAEKYPIIPKTERQPAQPVFGNAREGYNEAVIMGNVLPLPAMPKPESKSNQNDSQPSLEFSETLEDFLRRQNITYTPANESGKYYVTCPRKDRHTGGKHGKTDAYVFDDGTGWAFYCSHNSCENHRTWEAFRNASGIPKQEWTEQPKSSAKSTENAEAPPKPYRAEMTESGNIPFPIDALKGTIFDYYENAWAGKNETCPAYRFAELLCAFGARLGRSIRLEGVGYPTYANWYIVLIGESYFSKKSQSTMYNMPKLLQDDEGILVESGLSTPEGFISMLKTHGEDFPQPRVVIKVDEMKSLFTKSRMSASEGLIPKLTEAYGCPDSLSILKNEAISVDEPTISIMGNSTHQWLQSSVTLDDIGGGFINRFAFFTHEQQDWKPRTEKPDFELLNTVTESMIACSKMYENAVFELDEETGEIYDDWYKSTHEGLKSDFDGVSSASARVTQHTMKLALMLAIQDNCPNDFKIHKGSFQKACAVGKYWQNVNANIFKNLAADKLTEQEIRVLKALDALGGQATKTELSNKIGRHHLSSRDLQRILEALIATDAIVATPAGRSTMLTRIG